LRQGGCRLERGEGLRWTVGPSKKKKKKQETKEKDKKEKGKRRRSRRRRRRRRRRRSSGSSSSKRTYIGIGSSSFEVTLRALYNTLVKTDDCPIARITATCEANQNRPGVFKRKGENMERHCDAAKN
jgi:hypothetical protein